MGLFFKKTKTPLRNMMLHLFLKLCSSSRHFLFKTRTEENLMIVEKKLK